MEWQIVAALPGRRAYHGDHEGDRNHADTRQPRYPQTPALQQEPLGNPACRLVPDGDGAERQGDLPAGTVPAPSGVSSPCTSAGALALYRHERSTLEVGEEIHSALPGSQGDDKAKGRLTGQAGV